MVCKSYTYNYYIVVYTKDPQKAYWWSYSFNVLKTANKKPQSKQEQWYCWM